MAGSLSVLILDEPTNDLDPLRRRLVWDVLRTANRESGTTVIFVTHDAVEAEKVIERVGILRNGELVAVGRPSDLKREVDRKLRLELVLSPDRMAPLPAGLLATEVQPGRWITLLEREEAIGVLNKLDLSRIDDFRLYSATLEDLYVHYATQ
jgi:ABC-2 type transport system ATP-binding protein